MSLAAVPTHAAQRILICLHDFPAGGTERIAIRMATHWVEAGREVTILCGTEAGVQRASVDQRVRVVALDPPIARSPLSRFRLGRAMGKHLVVLKPDLIFLPGNFHVLIANSLRKAYSRAAIALKVSNPPVPTGLCAPIGWLIFKHFARGLDGLARMSHGLSAELVSMFPDKNVPVLYDPVYLSSMTTETLPKQNHKGLNILWAGRLEPQKDVPLALKVIDQLRRTHEAHLTFLGDGVERGQTERMIARLGLHDHVTMAGHVASIDPFLVQADVLLMTSHYEGGPAVVVEALAHGVPVVSTDCSQFLHDVMTIPAAGRIVATRFSGDLVAAVLEVTKTHRTPRELQTHNEALAPMVARYDPKTCAQAYLNWFDIIVRTRAEHSA